MVLHIFTGKASGKAGCFPYKMVRKGEVVVEGLPQAVLPLHPPSHYGEEKLKLLLSCPSISIWYIEIIFNILQGLYKVLKSLKFDLFIFKALGLE